MNSGDIAFIKHILDSIKDIEFSIKGLSKKEFQESKDVKDACIRRLDIIGEAVKNISESLKKKYSEIEWKKIAGTRDRVIHSYFRVNLDIVWDIIKINLPDLRREISKIKRDLNKI